MKKYKVTFRDGSSVIITNKKNVEDERLSPMTYKKLKELGYDNEKWKNLTQEQANKIVAQGKQQGNQKNTQSQQVEQNKISEKSSGNSTKTPSQDKISKVLQEKYDIPIKRGKDGKPYATIRWGSERERSANVLPEYAYLTFQSYPNNMRDYYYWKLQDLFYTEEDEQNNPDVPGVISGELITPEDAKKRGVNLDFYKIVDDLGIYGDDIDVGIDLVASQASDRVVQKLIDIYKQDNPDVNFYENDFTEKDFDNNANTNNTKNAPQQPKQVQQKKSSTQKSKYKPIKVNGKQYDIEGYYDVKQYGGMEDILIRTTSGRWINYDSNSGEYYFVNPQMYKIYGKVEE